MDGYFSPFAVWTELPKRVLKRGWARQRTLIGRELAWRVREHGPIKGFSDVEFSVFSQFGDDGIIQWQQRLASLRGLPVFNTRTGVEEEF